MSLKTTTMFIVAGLFCSTPASASHMIKCTIKARVVSLTELERLDGTVTFWRGPPGVSKNDFEQIATLELLEVDAASTREACPDEGATVTLYVPQAQQGDYERGSELLLEYRNMGDAYGSTIGWSIVAKGEE